MRSSSISSLECCRDLLPILEDIGKQENIGFGRLLYQRLQSPQAFVTVVGETSTGKTTLINGLIGGDLLPTSASPTTATVTHVVLDDVKAPCFLAISRRGEQEEVDHKEFVGLSLKPDKDLLRLRVDVPSPDQAFCGINVFDTPGFNVLLAEHEEILLEFLPESDVVVFVCGYKTGFGQIDQDLLEIVRKATAHDRDLPFVLAVNRAPAGLSNSDRRVLEILNNASDCLKKRPQLVLIAAPPIDGRGARTAGPDSSALWRSVLEHVNTPARDSAVNAKLVGLLGRLAAESHDALARKRLVLTSTEAELQNINQQIDEVRLALKKSLDAVTHSTSQLEHLLRPAIARASEGLVKQLSHEIDASEKWLGREDCVAWLGAHSLPFSIREASKEIERVIAEELERLDRELADIANTAIGKIERSVVIRSGVPEKMAQNLAVALAKKIGGQAVGQSLKGIGGVGGVAAGAGNFVKMAVKRIGALVGQKFGREVYNTIGRLFTKRVVTSAAVVLSLAIDAGVFIYDAQTWQKGLKKSVQEAVSKWREEVVTEVYQNQLPQISKANELGVRDIYESMLSEHASALQNRSQDATVHIAKLESMMTQLAALQTRIGGSQEIS